MRTLHLLTAHWPKTLLLLLLAGLSALGQAIYEPYTFTTLAGQAGGAGDADGTGPDARFNRLNNLIMAKNGDLYTMGMDSENLRKVTPAGVVTTEPFKAGSVIQAIDRAGNFYGVLRRLPNPDWIYKIAPDGSRERVAEQARFNTPAGLVVDDAGTLYVADTGNSTIRKITAAGELSLLAGKQGQVGTRDGTGSAAWFAFEYAPNSGFAMALDGAGNLYVPNRNTVRKVTPEGVVTTLAGKAGTPGTVDGTGAAARFQVLSGMAVDGSGNVYVSDNQTTVRKITAEGVVTTLAGKADTRGYVDGTGADARFGHILGLVADKAGNFFVADSDNNCIRKITPDGAVTTIAGRPSQTGIADGTGTAARFLSPVALAVDSTGNLAVADSSYKDLRQFFFNPL